jgi:hypothetical protein
VVVVPQVLVVEMVDKVVAVVVDVKMVIQQELLVLVD